MVFSLFCIAGSAFAQAYKWTDENGVVHFSDRPQPGAEEIVLPRSSAPSRIRPTAPSVRPTGQQQEDDEGDDEEAEEPENPYQSLSIASPASEETLWNIAGNLNVELSLEPALRPGHQIRMYVDGQPRIVTGTRFVIPEVWRGSHNLQAEVVNPTGELMIRSDPIRFYVQQTTVINRRPGPVPR